MSAAELALRQQLHSLYCDHLGWLQAWLRKKPGCPHHAADVAQNTFLRVLTAARRCMAWSSTVLADGSKLTLATASAVDVRLGAASRRVQLLDGEILVSVAEDAAPLRRRDRAWPHPCARHPLHRPPRVRVHAADHARIPHGSQCRRARARGSPGRGVGSRGAGGPAGPRDTAGRGAARAIDSGAVEDAFKLRRLVVQNRPLPEVLDELARHRAGVLRCERAAIEGIRVSAVLPLDDTDRALRLLVTDFPQLRVRTVTPWVVTVDTAR